MPLGISFFIPPLRHFVTPLLKERLFVRLPLRGAVNAVDFGVACSYFHMTVIFLSYRFPPLRHFVTPLLKERLLYGSHWGELATQLTVGWHVYIFIWLSFLSYRFPPLRHFVTPLLKERLLYGFYWGEPATQDFMPTYPRKKGIIVDNPF